MAKKKSSVRALTQAQVLRLAAEAQVDPRTVSAVYAAEKPTRPNLRQRVVDAASKLKMPAPPEACA